MENRPKIGTREVGSPVRSTLIFCRNELSSHLTNALQCMSNSDYCSGPQPEVYIHFGEKKMTVHATLLAALSSSWRKHLHAVMHQDAQIMHHIVVDIQVKLELLSTLKSLLYCGSAISSVPSSELMNVARALDLDHTEFLHSCYNNDLHTICWKGFHDRLTETLQFMCVHQLCTDVSILVDGHIIKAHKLILSACSSVLKDTFQENGRIGIIHMPNIGVMNAHSLITYMYYGEAVVMETHLTAFHKLCSSLEVMSLKEATECSQQEYEAFNKEQTDCLKLKAQIKSSFESVWGRLRQLYHDERKADLTFLVEKKRLSANKALLSAASPLIYEMLAQELTREHSLILITDMNYKAMQGLLDMIYNGSCTLAHSSVAVVCSYFDRSIIDIESSENEFQKENKPSNTLRDEKSKPHFPFSLKQGLKPATANSYFVPKNELFDTTMAESAERRKTSRAPEKSRYLQAADGIALSKAHEGTDFQAENDLEGKEQVIPHWNKSSAEAAQTGLRLCINTHDETSASHSSGKLNNSATSSSMRGNRGRCEKSFACRGLMHQHQKTHQEKPKSMICELCGKSNSHKALWIHMKPHKRNHQCSRCMRRFAVKNLLDDHIKVKHSGVVQHEYKCNKCSKTFITSSQLQNHMLRVHIARGSVEHVCKQDNRSYKTKSLLVDMQSHDLKVKPYKCSRCSADFYHRQSLKSHVRKMHTLRRHFTCSGCGKQFSGSDTMKKHELKCHQRQSQPVRLERVTEEMKSYLASAAGWSCMLCCQNFSDIEALEQHTEMLHNSTTTLLEDKGKASQKVEREGIANQNIARYPISDSKSCSCPDCGETFSDIASLSTHAAERNHAGVDKSCWICGLCGDAFLEENQLTKHMAMCEEHFGSNLVSSDFQKQSIEHTVGVTGKQLGEHCFSVGSNTLQFDETLKHNQKFLNPAHGLIERNKIIEKVTVCGNASPAELSPILVDSGDLIEVFSVNSDLINNPELNVASTVQSLIISASNGV